MLYNLMYNDNVKRTVIPIKKDTTIAELNNPLDVPEKGHRHVWSFFCVLTVFISSLFCCITI